MSAGTRPMIPILTTVILAAMLTGCATEETTPWHWSAGPGPEAFRRDNYECSRDSTVTAGGPALGVWWPGDWQRAAKDQATKLYRMCMESKGYVRECEPGSHWNDDRDKCKRPIR